jgi:hypothetical protein
VALDTSAHAAADNARKPRPRRTEAVARRHLREALDAHVMQLGYSSVRVTNGGPSTPEIVRVSPIRGRIAYGETVLHGDLRRKRCHERLLSLSQHRTRRRSSILLFLGVEAGDRRALEVLLERLEICSGIRGGHVHIVSIAAPERRRPAAPSAKSKRAAGAPARRVRN